MKTSTEIIRSKLAGQGLKVTPQRISILEAVYELGDHPTAESIIEHIRKSHPNIATGTVYHVLETLVSHHLIRKVKTEGDTMRYDGMVESHHHLYSTDSSSIRDYHDKELDELLEGYFRSKQIEGFRIEEVVLQIRGTFEKEHVST